MEIPYNVYGAWKTRKHPRYAKSPVTTAVRDMMPDDYLILMITVVQPKPWEDITNVIVVTIPPFHLVTGYNGKYIKKFDNTSDKITISDEKVIVKTYILSTYVELLLDGNVKLFSEFAWRSKSWHVESNIRRLIKSIQTYCLSKDLISRTLFDLQKDTLQLKEDSTSYMLPDIIHRLGIIKFFMRNSYFTDNFMMSTDTLNPYIVDNIIFARTENEVDIKAVITYVEGQILSLQSKVDTMKLNDHSELNYLVGNIQQLHLSYCKK